MRPVSFARLTSFVGDAALPAVGPVVEHPVTLALPAEHGEAWRLFIGLKRADRYDRDSRDRVDSARHTRDEPARPIEHECDKGDRMSDRLPHRFDSATDHRK
jgi:hypothetical protein